MKGNVFFYWLFMFSACAMIAIGRVFDDRLVLFGINIALIISIIFFLSSALLIVSLKKITITKSKFLLYTFYFLFIVLTPILWLFYGAIEYGILKYFNFFIVIFLSIVIVEKFNYKDVEKLLFLFLLVSSFLALLAILGQAISANNDSGRLSVLGGGPIIFSRWMGIGILILVLMPKFRKYKVRYLIIVLFFILSIASGSRGPVLTLFLVLCLFLFLNFRRYFLKFIVLMCFLLSLITFTDISKEVGKLGRVERILMNFSSRGVAKKSTGTRERFIQGAVTVFKEYPLGVGSGNWQDKSNEIDSQNLMPLEYSHNIFLEVLNEYGIILALILLMLFIYIFHLSYRSMNKYYYNESSLYTLLFYLLAYFFLNSLISGDINDTRILFVVISFILIKAPLINKI
jgi:O-antigen ligase